MKLYDDSMATERMTVSMDADLATMVRSAAEADNQNVSVWIADAARRRLATRGLAAVVADWEAEHGPFTDEELAVARRRLGK